MAIFFKFTRVYFSLSIPPIYGTMFTARSTKFLWKPRVISKQLKFALDSHQNRRLGLRRSRSHGFRVRLDIGIREIFASGTGSTENFAFGIRNLGLWDPKYSSKNPESL